MQHRPESEVLLQLKNWGKKWDNIRAIFLTSSRVDPKRTPDVLSDYDIEVYVKSVELILQNDSWLENFGSIMVRWPSRPISEKEGWVTQLVLFDDGVRIDFQFTDNKQVEVENLENGYKVIIDKDNLTKNLPAPTYSYNIIEHPTKEAFDSRLNAFWWDIVYVAKALYRGELNYAKYILEGTIRFEKLQPLITWHIGISHNWSINVGAYGRWFQRYLDKPTWEHYQRTFAGSSLEANWKALFETLEFVRLVGKRTANELGFNYPDEVDKKVTRYIQEIRELKRELEPHL
jgi:aminoglycoside 6-adenylyltransferase